MMKDKPLRDPAWLKAVREMPCVLTGKPGPNDPAHIRYGLGGGMGMKPPDNRVLPLSPEFHLQQHSIGERRFWMIHMMDNPDFMMSCILALAEKLYRQNQKENQSA